MKKVVERTPFFLILLPVFILLHIEKEYHFVISYSFVIKEILIILFAPLLFFLISHIFFRTNTKAIIFSFILLFFFYFSGPLKNYLSGSSLHFLSPYKVMVPFILTLIITSAILIKRIKNPKKIILFLNLMILLSIAIDLAALLFSKKPKSELVESADLFTACDTCVKPDIYYIIFDSYSNSSILKSEMSYENVEQDTYLKKNGFFILENSKSNYNLTPFCISTTFGLNYFAHIDTTRKYYFNHYMSAIREVYYSPLFSQFETQDYNIYNHSIFDFENYPSSIPSFDVWKTNNLYQQYNFIRKMHNETFWHFPSWLKLSFGKDPEETYINDRIAHDSIALAHLYKTIKDNNDKPKMVYGHIFLPHSPYYYDSTGTRIDAKSMLSPEEDKKAYISQLKYSNKIMRELVESLRENNKPKIVIIQGDHGYRFFDNTKKKEEFPNLNAIYVSPELNIQISDEAAGVNTFRWVLQSAFKQKCSFLPHQSFFLHYK